MAFLIRYSTDAAPGSVYTVLSLSPCPTTVTYPDYRLYNTRVTQDHAVIIQRPLKDDRARSWVWSNYRPTTPGFEVQWNTLLTLEARQRAQDGFNPIIQIWEDESANAGQFGNTTDDLAPDLIGYTNIEWTEVKILQATRRVRDGGGPVTFSESILEFLITDASWENF